MQKRPAANLGKTISITLDGETISRATVNTVIAGGKGEITGNFTRRRSEESGYADSLRCAAAEPDSAGSQRDLRNAGR